MGQVRDYGNWIRWVILCGTVFSVLLLCDLESTLWMFAMNDGLSQRAIEEILETNWLGQRVYYYPVVGSTNDRLMEMTDRGEPAGTIMVTDYQSRGKGRLGRRWVTSAGNSLLFSALFRPDWAVEKASWLTMMGGLACVESIVELTGLNAGLKWPNDIMISREERWYKAGGLLLETNIVDDRVQSAILGIGINVNVSPEELPESKTAPTSLGIELGRSIGRVQLLVKLLQRLEITYESINAGHSPHDAWNSLLINHGRVVRVTDFRAGNSFEGVAEGTDHWGRLRVRDEMGKMYVVSAGDVTLRS